MLRRSFLANLFCLPLLAGLRDPEPDADDPAAPPVDSAPGPCCDCCCDRPSEVVVEIMGPEGIVETWIVPIPAAGPVRICGDYCP